MWCVHSRILKKLHPKWREKISRTRSKKKQLSDFTGWPGLGRPGSRKYHKNYTVIPRSRAGLHQNATKNHEKNTQTPSKTIKNYQKPTKNTQKSIKKAPKTTMKLQNKKKRSKTSHPPHQHYKILRDARRTQKPLFCKALALQNSSFWAFFFIFLHFGLSLAFPWPSGRWNGPKSAILGPLRPPAGSGGVRNS